MAAPIFSLTRLILKQAGFTWAVALFAAAIMSTPSSAQTIDAAAVFDSHIQQAEWHIADEITLVRLSDATGRRAAIEAAANAGNADALLLSALAIGNGFWGPADLPRARELVRAAADKGQPRAMAMMGFVAAEGRKTPAELVPTADWFRKGADAGNGIAQAQLSLMIRNGQTTARSGEDMVRLMESAAEKGVPGAALEAANYYFDGRGVAKDDAKSRKLYQRAAVQGDVNGLAGAGALAWTAEREPMDSKFLGFAQLKLAADNGQWDAAKIVISAYLGETVHLNLVNPKAALFLLEKYRVATGGKNAEVNKRLSQAKQADARSRSGLAGFNFGMPTPVSAAVELNSREVIDNIKITVPVWPADIPLPKLSSIAGDRSPVDAYGISEREWRTLSASQFVGYALVPQGLKNIADGYAKRDPKALTLIGMVASATRSSKGYADQYPQCVDWQKRPNYCDGLEQKLNAYLKEAGIADNSVNRKGVPAGHLYGMAVADYLIAQPSMRAQLDAMLPNGMYNDRTRAQMLVFAQLGYLPAVQYLETKVDRCGSMSEDTAYFVRQGYDRRKLVDAAMALGDSEIGYNYALQLRDALCVGRDNDGALRLLRAAADMGNAKAKYALMETYAGYGGGNSTRRYREALRLADELARDGGPVPNERLLADIRKGAAEEAALRGAIGEVSDDPSRPPNAATIRAVVMRELKSVMHNFSGLSFMGLLGNPPYESWNYDDGSFLLETQNPNDMFAIYYRSDFFISKASCTAVAGIAQSYDCSYAMSASLDYRFGKLTLFNGSTGAPKLQKHRFQFADGMWRSSDVRAQVLSSMPANGIGAGNGGSANDNWSTSPLCKSLAAGVVAAGGNSTSTGLNPSTWNC